MLSCMLPTYQQYGAWNTQILSPVSPVVIRTWDGPVLELSLDLSDYSVPLPPLLLVTIPTHKPSEKFKREKIYFQGPDV
jgi:hypothetical protein